MRWHHAVIAQRLLVSRSLPGFEIFASANRIGPRLRSRVSHFDTARRSVRMREDDRLFRGRIVRIP